MSEHNKQKIPLKDFSSRYYIDIYWYIGFTYLFFGACVATE